jgi:hypothetical protein
MPARSTVRDRHLGVRVLRSVRDVIATIPETSLSS